MTDPKLNPTPLTAHGADPLSGRFSVPGDGTISLRALLLAALTVGRSTITGMRASREVLASAQVLRQMGVAIEQHGDAWHVDGLGVAGLLEPERALNSEGHADSTILLLGLLAPYGLVTSIDTSSAGEGALPPALLDGLGALGARVERRSEGGLSLHGASLPVPLRQSLIAPDEATKTALLLAGLQIAGDSVIHESAATADHTEKLLAAFGADITVTPDADDGEGVTIRLAGLPVLNPQAISVPGDPSAAAFGIVAALIIKGSELVVENVLINPLRTGLIDTLLEMGGDIQFLNQRQIVGEHVADLRVRSSWLKGVHVDRRHARAMLDDLPALAVAAAFAQGETIIDGFAAPDGTAHDQLDTLAAGLAANKVDITRASDSLAITGDGKVTGGASIECHGDAAIAMSFAIMGLASRHRITIRDAAAIAEQFPDFVNIMTAAGGRFPPSKGR